MIDFITNKLIHPKQILQVRNLNSAKVNSDDNLVLRKIKMKGTTKREKDETEEKIINIDSLRNHPPNYYNKKIKKYFENISERTNRIK